MNNINGNDVMRCIIKYFGFSFFNNNHKHHYHDNYTGCGHLGNKEENFFEKYIQC